MEQGRDLLHEVIAASAVDAPIVPHGLVGSEDLFHDDIGAVAIVPRDGVEARAQFATIADRVGQSVDMVDPYAVDQSLLIKPEIEGMGFREHLIVLDPQPARSLIVKKRRS